MNSFRMMFALACSTLAVGAFGAVAPDGYNVWQAVGDGLASDAANWSLGRAPNATDAVLFDGEFSNANCEWDAAASATVASWTQAETFTGTVTVDTSFDAYDAAFTNLVVSGNVTIAGGKLSPKTHGTATDTRYRLMMTVGGDFTVGANGKVSAAGLGRYSNSTWSGSSAHGGDCGSYNKTTGARVLFNTKDPAFGNLLAPTAVAHGAQSGTDSSSKKARGGGAIRIDVRKAFVNDGLVTADGGAEYSASAGGGSVYVTARDILGQGGYSASVPRAGKTDGTGAIGAGGRIALVASRTLGPVTATAYGLREGWGSHGAPGTVYLKSSDLAQIVVKGNDAEIKTTTPIPAADDSMDWWRCAKEIDLVASDCAHLRLTRDRVRVRSLSFVTAMKSDLDLAGRLVRAKAVFVDGVNLKLPAGDYTAARGFGWLTDSSEGQTGVLQIYKDGFVLRVR